ncbi:MAG: hypothetical protein KJ921_02525 [Proteobacteria bacterium]|nr:hypothetical protein [Pseudomonadota bacterium]
MSELSILLPEFFGTIQLLCDVCKEEPRLGQNKIVSFCSKIIIQLKSQDAMAEFEKAIKEVQEKEKGQIVLDLLHIEIKMFLVTTTSELESTGPARADGSVRADGSSTAGSSRMSVSLAQKRLSQAKTIKDSIEKIFNLPWWLDKILGILNELLSLVAPTSA